MCFQYQSSMLFTVRNEVAKVMFLHVSVILSTGGVPGPGGAWFGGVPGPSGYLLQGGLLGGGGVWRPPETATVAAGTHPTRMHSCSFIVSIVFAKLAILILFSTFYL